MCLCDLNYNIWGMMLSKYLSFYKAFVCIELQKADTFLGLPVYCVMNSHIEAIRCMEEIDIRILLNIQW